MEIDREICRIKNRVTFCVSGRVGFAQFRRVFDEMLSDPHFQRNMDILWDLRRAEIEANVTDVARVVAHIRARREQRGSDYRTAIIAAEGAGKAASRLFQIFARMLPFETRVFSTIDGAESWLDKG